LTKERFETIARWLTARPGLLKLLKALNRGLPAVMYAAYPLLLIVLAAARDGRFYRVLAVPAAVFIIVTCVRRLLNRPRPYEKLQITPLLQREGAGQSFPSRHAASATVIAAAFWYISVPAGFVMALAALLISAVRVVAGLHFPRDAAAGVLLSLVLSAAGFWLI
jgi:phosphatidylglycerophosphatase B